jgi:hypothetical protein
MTDYLENKVLDGTVKATTYTAPANVYMALYSVAPSESGTGTELTGNGYGRQLITFGTAAANGTISNTANLSFTASGNAWSVKGQAITDAASGGNILYWSTTNRALAAGETLTYLTGKINISIN